MAEGLDVALREEIVTKTGLKSQLAELKHDMLRWMIGSQFVLAGFILGVLKFFGH
jgi:ATP-dependent protease ClpP protease subunit